MTRRQFLACLLMTMVVLASCGPSSEQAIEFEAHAAAFMHKHAPGGVVSCMPNKGHASSECTVTSPRLACPLVLFCDERGCAPRRGR